MAVYFDSCVHTSECVIITAGDKNILILSLNGYLKMGNISLICPIKYSRGEITKHLTFSATNRDR